MRILPVGLCVLLVAVMVAAAVPVAAQGDNDFWRFAYDPVEKTVIAYTMQGETRPVLTWDLETSPDARISGIVRLTPESAVILLKDDDLRALFVVTADGAAGTDAGTAQQILDSPLDFLNVVTVSDDWVILRSRFIVFNEPDTAAINRHTGEVQMLTGAQGIAGRCYLAGDLVRYVSEDSAYDWTLWERNLVTGEERAVNALTPFDGRDTGAWWLILEQGETWIALLSNLDLKRYLSYDMAGGEEVFAEYTRDDFLTWWPFDDEAIYGTDRRCKSDCTLTWYQPDQDQKLYRMPGGIETPEIRTTLPGGRLLMSDSNAYYVLSTDAPPQLLGFMKSPSWPASYYALSADKRWLALYADDSGDLLQIWDLQTLTMVGEPSPDWVTIRASYTAPAGTLLLLDQGNNPPLQDTFYVLLSNATGTMTVLPLYQELGLHYLEVLDDESLLAKGEEGIVHLDLAAGLMETILPGSWRTIVFLQ